MSHPTNKHPENLFGRLPYLVQRLKARDFGTRTGVDRYFAMDYMGSSEFEWGALPAALRQMRAAMPLPMPLEVKATRDDKPVSGWYVGDPANLDVATYWFSGLAASEDATRSFSMKERAKVYEALGPDPLPPTKGGLKGRPNYAKSILGWWCVDEDRTWAIFTTKEHADNWLRGIAE